jgi:predicted ester cyclase
MDLRRQARDLLESVWTRGREATLRAAVTDDFRHRLATAGEALDVDGYLSMVRGYRAAFSPIDLIFHRVLVDGDRAAIHFSMTGTHTGPIFGLAPTGRPCWIEVMCTQRWRDGALARQVSVTDFLALRRQLRAMP